MGTQCSAHYIRYDTLYVYVLSRIQYWSHRAQMSEEKLLQQILKNGDRERITAAKRQESELKRAEKRKAEVDGKFVRMYEDWSAGRITEYNFNLLTKKYQAEQLGAGGKNQPPASGTDRQSSKLLWMPKSGSLSSSSTPIPQN